MVKWNHDALHIIWLLQKAAEIAFYLLLPRAEVLFSLLLATWPVTSFLPNVVCIGPCHEWLPSPKVDGCKLMSQWLRRKGDLFDKFLCFVKPLPRGSLGTWRWYYTWAAAGIFMHLLFFPLTPAAAYSGTSVCVAKWWARLEKLLGSKEMETFFNVFIFGGWDVTAQDGAAGTSKEQSGAGPVLW